MLQAIRRGSNSFLVRALLLLIIAAFALWGVGVGSGTPTPVATVGGEPIPQIDYQNALRNEMSARQSEVDDEYGYPQAHEDGLHLRVLQQLITAKTLDMGANNLGLRASDRQVYNAIRDIPFFNDATAPGKRILISTRLNSILSNTESTGGNP